VAAVNGVKRLWVSDGGCQWANWLIALGMNCMVAARVEPVQADGESFLDEGLYLVVVWQ
jgi:hypothetical protein